MSVVSLKAKLLRWGNSYGLRLTRRDVERLRLAPGKTVDVKIEVPGPSIEPKKARAFHLGGRAAMEHDKLFEESLEREEDEDPR